MIGNNCTVSGRLWWHRRTARFPVSWPVVELHGFRSVVARQTDRLGVQLKHPTNCTESLQFNCTPVGSVKDYPTRNTQYPSCTAVQNGPNTPPQLAYRVKQIGDCVVTQRPRARVVMADRQNGTLTQIGK